MTVYIAVHPENAEPWGWGHTALDAEAEADREYAEVMEFDPDPEDSLVPPEWIVLVVTGPEAAVDAFVRSAVGSTAAV